MGNRKRAQFDEVPPPPLLGYYIDLNCFTFVSSARSGNSAVGYYATLRAWGSQLESQRIHLQLQLSTDPCSCSFKYSCNRVLTEVWAEGLGKKCTLDGFSLHRENWRNYRCEVPLRSAVFSHEMFVLLFFLSSAKPKEGARHRWGNLSPWSFNPCICFSYPHPFFEQNCFMKSHPLVE